MTSNIAQIRMYLDGGISNNPMLLHGSSTQAIEILARTGRMPLGDCNAFYFTPISHRFEKSEYNVPLKAWRYTKRKAISQSKFYARICSLEASLSEEFGYLPDWFWDVPDTQEQVYLWFLEEEGWDKSRKLLKQKIRNAFQNKGVIIEPSEEIFRLIYGPGDDNNTIAFGAPGGLPIEYIKGIQPLSRVDRQRLERLLD